jgi:hypothetical protein
MIRSMGLILNSPLRLVFSEAFQPCILASASIARILSAGLMLQGSIGASPILCSFSVAYAKFASIVLASFSFTSDA